MNIDAMLCDAATVREGLLNVLGAGITRLHREQFPAAMGTQLALLLHSNAKEMGKPHKLLITITHETKEKIAELEASKPKKEDAPEDVIEVKPMAETEKTCPVCGVKSDSKFCPECGAPMGE